MTGPTSTPAAGPAVEERIARYLAAKDWLTDPSDNAWWDSRAPKFRDDYLAAARTVLAIAHGHDQPTAPAAETSAPALTPVPDPDEPTRVTLPEIAGVHAVRHTPDGIPRTACNVSIYTPQRHAVPDDTDITCWRCRQAIAEELGP